MDPGREELEFFFSPSEKKKDPKKKNKNKKTK